MEDLPTITRVSRDFNISTRTIRYYDEIGILKPARINSSGYRIYGRKEVDRLQQILFYRELGVSLESIGEIVTAPSFDGAAALREHREKLLEKREQLDRLIANVERTIAVTEGRATMSNNEKFEGFKQKMIDENEKKYGKEVRGKYGDEAVNRSNNKIKGMTEEQHAYIEKLSNDMNAALKEAYAIGDPAGELAQKAIDMHRQWLTFYWDNYSKEAHAGVAQMYVDDERFTAYYDKIQPGLAVFIRDAVLVYTGMNK